MSLNFGNYRPETFGWTKTNGDNDQFWYDGVEIAGGINKAAGYRELVTLMLDELVPHIPGGLKAGWCWGGDTSDSVDDSFHKYAIAMDFNAPVNAMSSTPPNFGQEFVLPQNTGDIIRKYGFEWGGNWDASTPPDYMHIEFQGSPDEIPVILAQLHAAPSTPTPAPTPAPTTPAVTDLLEQIMTLTGAPTTYAQLISDISEAVADVLAQEQSKEQRNPGGLAVGIDDAANAVNHGEDWDHTPQSAGVTAGMSAAQAQALGH